MSIVSQRTRSHSLDRQDFRAIKFDMCTGNSAFTEKPRRSSNADLLPMRSSLSTPKLVENSPVRTNVHWNASTEAPCTYDGNPAPDQHEFANPGTWQAFGAKTGVCVSESAKAGLRSVAWTLSTGLWAAQSTSRIGVSALVGMATKVMSAYTATNHYLQQIKPANSTDIIAAFDTLKDVQHTTRSMKRELHLRQAITREQGAVLGKLENKVLRLPQIQEAIKNCQKIHSACAQFLQSVAELEKRAQQCAQRLVKNPTNAGLESTLATCAQLLQESAALSCRASQAKDTLQDISAQVQHTLERGVALQDATQRTTIQSAALHLNLSWSDWSAFHFEMFNRYDRTGSQQAASLEYQTSVQQDLAQTLSQVVALQHDIERTDKVCEQLTSRLKDLSQIRRRRAKEPLNSDTDPLQKLVQTREIDEKLIKDEILDLKALHRNTQQRFATALELAANAVSHGKRHPSMSQLGQTERFLHQLTSLMTNLRSQEVTKDQGALLDFFRGSALVAQKIGPDALIGETCEFLSNAMSTQNDYAAPKIKH